MAEVEALAEHFHADWCNSTHHRSAWCRERVATLDMGKAERLLASDWLAAYVAAARAEEREATLGEVAALADRGEMEIASLIRRVVQIQPFGPKSIAVHAAGGSVMLTPAEAEAAARAVLDRLRALLPAAESREGDGR